MDNSIFGIYCISCVFTEAQRCEEGAAAAATTGNIERFL